MRVRSALLYTVLRLAAFLVPFGLMMLIPIYYIFTASPEELEAGRRDRADTL